MTTISNLGRSASRMWAWIQAIDRFVRLYILFFPVSCVLLGAASVPHDITLGQLGALVGVATCFQIYTYAFNDVIDLSIDRINPARRQDPLVRGVLTPRQAVMIGVVQPLLAIPLTMALGAGAEAYVTLAASFALMGAYNVWGKRCPFPPLTDAVQGLAWSGLSVYGAQAIGVAPTALTWWLAAYLTVFTLLFNGIYGPFRDLISDFAAGAKTTAIVFGARPASAGRRRYVPTVLSVYAWCLLVLLVGMNAVLMFRNDFHYGTSTWVLTACIVGALNVWAVLLQPQVLHPRESAADVAWRLQMFILMTVLPIAFFASAGAGILLTLAFLNALALVLFDSTSAVTRWAWGIIGAVSHVVHEEHRPPARITHAD